MRLFLPFLFILIAAMTANPQENLVERFYPPQVSLVHLISHPEKYDGKRVLVIGYLHFRFEDSALYLSKTDADYIVGQNAVWVTYDDSVKLEPLGGKEIVGGSTKDLEYFDGRYVMIEATFNIKAHGHMGMFFGALEKGVRLSESRQWFDGRKQLTKFDKRGRVVPRKSR